MDLTLNTANPQAITYQTEEMASPYSAASGWKD